MFFPPVALCPCGAPSWFGNPWDPSVPSIRGQGRAAAHRHAHRVHHPGGAAGEPHRSGHQAGVQRALLWRVPLRGGRLGSGDFLARERTARGF